jgi:hypothetical protein
MNECSFIHSVFIHSCSFTHTNILRSHSFTEHSFTMLVWGRGGLGTVLPPYAYAFCTRLFLVQNLPDFLVQFFLVQFSWYKFFFWHTLLTRLSGTKFFLVQFFWYKFFFWYTLPPPFCPNAPVQSSFIHTLLIFCFMCVDLCFMCVDCALGSYSETGTRNFPYYSVLSISNRIVLYSINLESYYIPYYQSRIFRTINLGLRPCVHFVTEV